MKSNRCLIIFTRYPQAGTTKTRLIPAVGAEKAAEIGRQLTEYTVMAMRQSPKSLTIAVHFTGGNKVLMEQWLGADLLYQEQGLGDLGARMKSAFQSAFAEQMTKVVIIGTDCPSLDFILVSQAIDALSDYDLVLGPAVDGGYYLIALRSEVPQLFENINWGSAEVFDQTLLIAQQLRLKVYQLPVLADIDRPEDLELCRQYNIIGLG